MGAVWFTTASVLLELCSTVDTLSYSVPTGSPLSDLPQPEPVLAQQDHALHSLSFFPPPNSLRPGNEHGFVLARIIEDGYTLELRWIAFTTGQGHGAGGKGKGKAELDGPPALPPVRFVFPARLVPDPTLSIRTGDEPSLEVLALTEAGYLYALSFPADSLFYDPALQNEQWSEEFSIDALQHRVPVLVHAVDEGRLVIGSSDGHVLSVEVLEDGGLTELELRPATSFSVRSLLPSFSTRTNSSNNLSNSSPTQLLSLSSAPGLSFAFGVTRDRKLKVWNLDTGACLKAIDLPKPAKLASSMLVDSDSPGPKAITTLLPSTPRPFVKVVRGDDTALFLVLFTPGAAFVVYAITTDAAGAVSELNLVGEQACGPATGTLVDFQLAQFSPAGVTDAWTLWTLWEEGSASEVRFVPVPELGGASATDDENVWTVVDPGPSGVTAQWNAGHFDELLRDDPEKGVTATFVEHVFYPGRYPPATLEYAIAVYEDALLAETMDPHSRPEALTFEYPSVSERIAAVVGCSVQLDVSPQTGAVLYDSYTKRLKGEWLRFVAIANESRTAALFPLALSVSPERGAALVVMRDAVAVPIVQDTVRVLQDLDPDSRTAFLALPPHAFEATYPHLAPRDIRQDLFTILDAIGTLSRALSSTAARKLELELVAKVRTPFAAHVEDVAIELYEGSLEPYVTADVRDAVNEQLGILVKAEASFQALWTLLTTPEVVKPLVSKRTAPPSDLASALLTDAVAVSIEARYRLVGGLATLLLFICGDSTASALLPDPASLTSGTLATLHTHASLRWVAQQAAAPLPPPPSSADDSILERFDSLNVTRDVDSPVASFSLLNGLLRDPAYSPPLSLSSPLASSLTGGVSTFLDRTGLIIHKRLVVDSPGDVRFAKGLQERGLPDLALEFAELYPKGTGMLYVMGKAYVDLGRWEEAVKAFERAAPALYEEGVRVDEGSGISHVLPRDIGPGLGGYYRHVVDLFASNSVDLAVVKFAALALDALEEEGGGADQDRKELWGMLFKSNAALGLWEDAYVSLMEMPFADIKSTSLAYLVSVMCENGQVELLTRWSFIGLQSELESILNFRARNSDPTAVPNYYRILYAYHVAKGDYRSAGGVMFQQGRRIGELPTRGLPFHEIATMQCQSYLAAANALSLVDKRHAWVAVLGDAGTVERGPKRRKLTYHIPEPNFQPGCKAVEVVDLDDIRREYTVALSRLQLAVDFPELERTNLDSEGVVALFAQTCAFESAFSSAQTLEVDMSSLFEVVTEKCVGLALNGLASDDADWVAMSDEASSWEGSLASKAWRLLESYLARHDDETFKYRVVVLERALAVDRGGKVPSWLVDFFLANDAPRLVRTMVKFDRLDDAFRYSLVVIQQASASPSAPAASYLPYALFDQLLAIAPDDSPSLSAEALVARQHELEAAVDARLVALERAQRALEKNSGSVIGGKV